MPRTCEADEAFLIGPAIPAESYLESRRSSVPPRSPALKAIHPGYGFLAENADIARASTRPASPSSARRLRRSTRWAQRPRPARSWRRPACRSCPARPSRAGPRRSPPAGRRGRLPGRLQGGRRRRRQGLPRRDDPGRPGRSLRRLGPRRREVLLRLPRLHRALPRGPAPRRGPGAGRLARQRDPPRRARLLDPAPSPEGDRGGPRPARRRGDARADRQDRHRRGRRGRLSRRGHDRGHAGRRRVLLPRDEHPRPGRALRDRDDQRHRHRARADPGRRRRAALDLPGRRRPARLVDRVPDQRRERRTRNLPPPRVRSAFLPRALGPRRARRLRRRGRLRGDADVRPDGREARRLGHRPREGDAADAAGARRIRLRRPADPDPLPQGDPGDRAVGEG